jgi:hypothetical protein
MKRFVIATVLALTCLFPTSSVAWADETTCEDFLGAVIVDNLRVPQDATCTLDGTLVQGTITVETNATLYASNVAVVGNVQAENAARVEVLPGSAVGGSIQIVQGGGAVVDSVQITGDLFFDKNELDLTATGNQVGGNLQAFTNTGGVTITDNIVEGNLQCKENSPAPSGGNNVVQGNLEDQCAELGVDLQQRAFLPFIVLYVHAPETTGDPGP